METDGIQGVVYKVLRAPLSPFIRDIMNHINTGPTMPDAWEIGGITHIRKKIARLNVTIRYQYD